MIFKTDNMFKDREYSTEVIYSGFNQDSDSGDDEDAAGSGHVKETCEVGERREWGRASVSANLWRMSSFLRISSPEVQNGITRQELQHNPVDIFDSMSELLSLQILLRIVINVWMF